MKPLPLTKACSVVLERLATTPTEIVIIREAIADEGSPQDRSWINSRDCRHVKKYCIPNSLGGLRYIQAVVPEPTADRSMARVLHNVRAFQTITNGLFMTPHWRFREV